MAPAEEAGRWIPSPKGLGNADVAPQLPRQSHRGSSVAAGLLRSEYDPSAVGREMDLFSKRIGLRRCRPLNCRDECIESP